MSHSPKLTSISEEVTVAPETNWKYNSSLLTLGLKAYWAL